MNCFCVGNRNDGAVLPTAREERRIAGRDRCGIIAISSLNILMLGGMAVWFGIISDDCFNDTESTREICSHVFGKEVTPHENGIYYALASTACSIATVAHGVFTYYVMRRE